jgi:hypothetical protein
MKTLAMAWRGLRERLGLLALVLVAALWAEVAGAAMVLVSDTSLVSGSQSSVFSFEAPGPGMVTAELSNLAWPASLDSLTLATTTAEEVMGQISASTTQSDSFRVLGGVDYFAHINAVAGGPLDLGLYSLSVTFTPAVPLPATGWLMALALVALAIWGYLNRRLIATGSRPAVGVGGSAGGSAPRAGGQPSPSPGQASGQLEPPPAGTLFGEWLPTK